jgi:hypothetical protein
VAPKTVWMLWRRKNLLPLPGIEPRLLNVQPIILIPIQTELLFPPYSYLFIHTFTRSRDLHTAPVYLRLYELTVRRTWTSTSKVFHYLHDKNQLCQTTVTVPSARPTLTPSSQIVQYVYGPDADLCRLRFKLGCDLARLCKVKGVTAKFSKKKKSNFVL